MVTLVEDSNGFSTVDRIDYSNDTATAVAKGPLSLARYSPGATGNTSYGYFGGGYRDILSVDRIDYSSDTGTALTKGPLELLGGYKVSAGNANLCYFGGGYPAKST